MHLDIVSEFQPSDVFFVDGTVRVKVLDSMRAAIDNTPYEPSTARLDFEAWLCGRRPRLWVAVRESSRTSWIDGRPETSQLTERLFSSHDGGRTWTELEWWRRMMKDFVPPPEWPESLDALPRVRIPRGD